MDQNQEEIDAEAARKRREEQRGQVNRKAQDEIDENKGLKDAGEAGFETRGPDEEIKPGEIAMRGLNSSKISDRGGYLLLTGGKGQKDPRTGERAYSPEQVKKLLMAGILNKGWDTFAFYQGKSIDKNLTSMADNLLKNDPGLQKALAAKGIEPSSIRVIDSLTALGDTLDKNNKSANQSLRAPRTESGVGRWLMDRKIRHAQKTSLEATAAALGQAGKVARDFGSRAEGRAYRRNLREQAEEIRAELRSKHYNPIRGGVSKVGSGLRSRFNAVADVIGSGIDRSLDAAESGIGYVLDKAAALNPLRYIFSKAATNDIAAQGPAARQGPNIPATPG